MMQSLRTMQDISIFFCSKRSGKLKEQYQNFFDWFQMHNIVAFSFLFLSNINFISLTIRKLPDEYSFENKSGLLWIMFEKFLCGHTPDSLYLLILRELYVSAAGYLIIKLKL